MAPSVTCARHFYGARRIFEQSLDVYTPADAPSAAPLVVLVVGSAWLGHRAAIYRATSWWNSSGPAAVARTGCVCVCIRHRGAFPRPPPLWLFCLLAALALLWFPTLTAALIISVCPLWHALARGDATHDQMVSDVRDALGWVAAQRHRLVSPGRPPAAKLIFGGYSSGAHVAISLLQQREAEGCLPANVRQQIDGVLLLSGVLGVRDATQRMPSAWAPHALIVRAAFGDGMDDVPSPVHKTETVPLLPHLLIYCEHEVFNLQPVERWLAPLFSSPLFAAKLRQRGVPVREVAVQSDHWNVLSSAGFASAIRKVLIEEQWPPSS